MHISQKLVIAICGRSCTGKSTVSETIAEKNSLPIRSCGDVTLRMAAQLNVGVGDLTDDCHRMIDAETVEWVRKARASCLVEGRYLDRVLASVAPFVVLVRFEASAKTRALRGRQKVSAYYNVADIRKADSEDDAFCMRMYEGVQSLQPDITFDTTCATPEEIAICLIRMVRVAKNGHD